MFDLKLTDVFSTLCIGILTLSLILYFYFIINKFFVKNKFDGDVYLEWLKKTLESSYEKNGYMVIAFVIVYCLGVISGDLTGRMTDSDSAHKGWLLKELKKVSFMESQDGARKDALLDSTNNWKLTQLGNSVLRSVPIIKNANQIAGTKFLCDTTRSFDENWKKLNALLISDSLNKNNSRKSFNNFLQQIYYTGKNWCFSKDHEPLNELKSIQNRIDLSRSMVLLVAFSFQFLLVIVILNLFYTSYNKITKKKEVKELEKKTTWDLIFHLFQINFLALLFIIGYVSRDCYNINEDNYNKRAYGYYVSEINRVEYLKRIDEIPIKSNKPIN